MNSEHLAETFVELADSLVADFDVIEFLHTLTTRCTELLAVEATGVLLADPSGHLRVMAASSEHVRLLELFQLQSDEGPCLECFHTGRPVNVADLSLVGARWPRFGEEARRHGFGAVQAIPMRLREEVIGALNLFGASPGLEVQDSRIAQAMADVATIGLFQHRAQRRMESVLTQLQTALNSRVCIEQAKGVLAERLDVDMDGAFTILRAQARRSRRHLSEVAQAVVEGSEDVSAFRPN
jgi:GAF domain-containing protein